MEARTYPGTEAVPVIKRWRLKGEHKGEYRVANDYLGIEIHKANCYDALKLRDLLNESIAIEIFALNGGEPISDEVLVLEEDRCHD